MNEQLQRWIAPLVRAFRLAMFRCKTTGCDDSKPLQGLQIGVLTGGTLDLIPRLQQYGLTSVPLAGCDVLIVCPGGDRSRAVAVAVDDAAHRPTGLQPGEVQLYSKFGHKLHFKNDGSTALQNQAGTGTVTLNADGSIVVKGGAAGITLDGGPGNAKGLVNGDCVCAFTGAPHPMSSVKVKGSL